MTPFDIKPKLVYDLRLNRQKVERLATELARATEPWVIYATMQEELEDTICTCEILDRLMYCHAKNVEELQEALYDILQGAGLTKDFVTVRVASKMIARGFVLRYRMG